MSSWEYWVVSGSIQWPQKTEEAAQHVSLVLYIYICIWIYLFSTVSMPVCALQYVAEPAVSLQDGCNNMPPPLYLPICPVRNRIARYTVSQTDIYNQ